MSYYVDRAIGLGRRDLADHLMVQNRQAHKTGNIACVCGRLRHFTLMFRCFFCGQYLCRGCAELHFGKNHEKNTPDPRKS